MEFLRLHPPAKKHTSCPAIQPGCLAEGCGRGDCPVDRTGKM